MVGNRIINIVKNDETILKVEVDQYNNIIFMYELEMELENNIFMYGLEMKLEK